MGDRIHRTTLNHRPLLRSAALCTLALVIGACGPDDTPDRVDDALNSDARADIAAGGALDLLPIEPVRVAAGEQLQVRITANNPRSAPLQWTALMPDLPGIATTWDIAGTTDSALFQWTPLPSHVGEHVVTIEATDGEQTVAEVVRISVTEGAGSAPRFDTGNQGLLVDLSQTSCAEATLSVTDPDSDSVVFRAADNAPAGLSVSRLGPLQMRLSWCPSQAQLDRSLRWSFDLIADDGTSATRLNYTIVFRRPQRDGCAGTAPEIAIISPAKGDELAFTGGYEVLIEASDREGLRQPPVLFWTTDAVADESAPDLASFQVASCTSAAGSAGRFVCLVPDLELTAGQSAVVNALASVTDNDDESGSACDKTTDTELTRFVALPAAEDPPPVRPLCAACTADVQCGAGVCTVGSGGALLCQPVCSSSCGNCVERRSANAEIRAVCADECEAASVCVDDENEPNDVLDEATILIGASIDGRICPADTDLFALEVVEGQRVQVSLQIADGGGDLDLGLSTLAGAPISVSAGTTSTETITFCPGSEASEDGLVIAEVVGFEDADGAYTLRVEPLAGPCCVDDPLEENDTASLAIGLDSGDVVEATICPDDSDFYEVVLDAPGTLRALLVFESDTVDLDMDLLDSGGRIVDSAATLSDELLRVPLTAGRWQVRVYGFDGDAGDYLLEVETTGLETCAQDRDCSATESCRPVVGDATTLACGTSP